MALYIFDPITGTPITPDPPMKRPCVMKMGDEENFVEIDQTGNMRFAGSSTIWRDELGPLIGQKLETPGSHIVQNAAEGSLTFKPTSDLSDYVVMPLQINHDWLLGSVVKPHLHWWQAAASLPNWLLQHRWQVQGGLKTTAWTSAAPVAHVFAYVSGTLNQISRFGDITPPAGYGLSDILQLRLLRDASNASGLFAGADPLGSNVDGVSFDCHLERDSFGSRQEYVK